MKPHIKEAYRYLENADKLLKDNCTIDATYKIYSDKKYVRMAGHTAYSGVLVALEPFIDKSKKQRISVDTYKDIIAKRNKRLVNVFLNVYSCLHLALGYDGNTNIEYKKAGWKDAKTIIDWADEHTTALGGIKTKKTRTKV